MTYFPLYQTTCFFIPLVAPCKPLLATHNNTIGVSVHPDYIIYACKEVLSDGKLEYHLYSGYPSSEDLVDLKGNHISRKSVLLDCLEAGETAYMDRRNSYEILNG